MKHLAALHDIYAQILVAVGNHRKEELLAKNLYADKHLHHTHLASNMAPTHENTFQAHRCSIGLRRINYILHSFIMAKLKRRPSKSEHGQCTFRTHSAINRNLDFYISSAWHTIVGFHLHFRSNKNGENSDHQKMGFCKNCLAKEVRYATK